MGIQYRLEGDSIIPNVGKGNKLYYRQKYRYTAACPEPQYNLIPGPWLLVGLLDQNQEQKKVYFTLLTQHSTLAAFDLPFQTTVLLYDFDLKAGQMVDWKPEPKRFLYSDTVRTKTGVLQKRYYFEHSTTFQSDTSYYWIEGIGGSFGLFSSFVRLDIADWVHQFNCFRSDGGFSYSIINPIFCDSISIVDIPKIPLDNLVQLYPNPTVENVTIKLPDSALPAIITWYNGLGQTLQTIQQSENERVHTLSVLTGSRLFWVQIKDEGGRSAVKKVVIVE